MIGFFKKILVAVLTALNVVAAALMLMSGYSYLINPVGHELLACAGMILPALVLLNLAFIPAWMFVEWRRLWMPVLALALAYVPIRIYIPLHADEPPPAGAIRIVSWNVCGFGGNFKYPAAVDSVLAYVQRQQADIVCLQEDMGKDKVIERMAEVFPYNDTTRLSAPHMANNSLGIHTRYPIIRKEVINYESQANGSVAYYLLIGRDTVLLINNHLESTHLSPVARSRYTEMLKGDMTTDTVKTESLSLAHTLGHSMAIRAPHAETVHQYVEQHRRYPIIVCGDFNDTPISYTRYTMAKGLTDCYVESGRGVGVSYNRKGFSFRIDHLLVSHHFTPYQCKIDSKNDVSDHYPLLCWLKMTDKP